MEILHWEPALSVGVPEIDNEHRLICSLVNDLLKVAEAGQGVQAQVVRQSLDDLLDCIQRHFASEEKFLLAIAYPDHEAHQQLHRILESGLEQFQTHGNLCINRELIDFLSHWFLDHLQNEDRKYATFLIQQQ